MGTPKQMEVADFKTLPSKHNWTPEVKKGNSSIFVDDRDPPVIIAHFAVAVVHAVKAYGQYGKLTERYKTACGVINYALEVNKFVVPHSKVQGQRLRLISREMLQSWIESLCENFSGDNTNHYFQGDGDAGEVTDEVFIGIPRHALTDGTQKTANQLYSYHLDNLKAQKEAGNYLVSEAERAQEIQRTNMMNNINRVTSGTLIVLTLSFSLYKCYLTVFYLLILCCRFNTH